MPTYGDNQCLGRVLAVDLDAEGDTAITIPNGGKRYNVTSVIATNATADLSGGSVEAGLYTAVEGGGVEVVAAVVMTGLTTAAKTLSFTVASSDTIITSTLYVNVSVENGTAAKADFYVFGNIYS